jgi:outer membrane protein OmpA-like peptidoglycan-associated protein
MGEYRLTVKGKVTVGVLMIVLALGMVSSGVYIWGSIQGASDVLPSETEAEATSSNVTETVLAETTESSTEASSAQEENSSEAQSGTEYSTVEETIYSQEDLDVLAQTRAVLYFEEGSSTYDEKAAYDALKEIIRVMELYPDEPLTIAGYVNGYPSFIQTSTSLALSKERAMSILQYFLDRGIDKSRINVYNFGSEAPASRQSAKQWQNDRVEVYFENHYVAAPGK